MGGGDAREASAVSRPEPTTNRTKKTGARALRQRRLTREAGERRTRGFGDGLAYIVIRIATRYFCTDVLAPGVSPAGIAFSVASPRA